MRVEQCLLLRVRHFGLGYATHQMGAHVMWLRRWGVIGITADVEVVAVGLERGDVHDRREPRLLFEGLKGGDDLLDVLGHQEVLRPTFEVLAVGVDEQHLALALFGFAADPLSAALHALSQHQDARRNARAIEQVGRHADDGFQQIVINHAGADGAFLAAPEQHSVRHDGGNLSAIGKHGDHVLQEHQVSFLGPQRHLAVIEALGAELRCPG